MEGYGYHYPGESSQVPPDYNAQVSSGEDVYLQDELGAGYGQGQFQFHDTWVDENGEHEELVIDDDFGAGEPGEDGEEEDEEREESWIPYALSPEQNAQGGHTQQVIIGTMPSAGSPWGFPGAEDLHQHWCDLYPRDCAAHKLRGREDLPTGVEGRANATVDAGKWGRWGEGGEALKHVDFSGAGLALMLMVLVLLGLNVGWGKESKQAQGSGSGSGGSGSGIESGSGSGSGNGSGRGREGAPKGDKGDKDQPQGDDKPSGKGSKPPNGKPDSKDSDRPPEGKDDKPAKGQDGKGNSKDPGKGGSGESGNGKDKTGNKPKDGRDGPSRAKGPKEPKDGDPSKKAREPGKEPKGDDPSKKPKSGLAASSGGDSKDLEKQKERERAKREADKKLREKEDPAKKDDKKKEEAGKDADARKKQKEKDQEAAAKEAEKAKKEKDKADLEKKKKEKEDAAKRGDQKMSPEKKDEGKIKSKDPTDPKNPKNAKEEKEKREAEGLAKDDRKLSEKEKRDTGKKKKEEDDKKGREGDKLRKQKDDDEKLAKLDGKENPKNRDSGGSEDSRDSGDSKGRWLTPQKLLVGLIILIPLLALLSGRGDGTKTTSTRGIITPPTRHQHTASSNWVVNEPLRQEAPRQVINNVHAQGTDIPINSGADGTMRSGPVVLETSEQVIRESPALGYEFHFTGPADPDRFFGMLFALSIVCLPLLVDWIRGWPRRKYVEPDYLSPTVHYVLFAIFGVFLLWKFNQEFGYFARLRPGAVYLHNRVIYLRDNLRTRLPETISASAQGAESFVWDVEDLLFGDGRELLGLMVSALGLIFLSQRSPPSSSAKRKPNYAEGLVQLLYVLGALIFGLLFMSA